MLSPDITIYDVAWLLTLCVAAMSLYITYHIGYRNGHMDGCKIRRRMKRKVRKKETKGELNATRCRYIGMGPRH